MPRELQTTHAIEPAVLRLSDVASYLRVSPWTIQRWQKRGLFPRPLHLGAPGSPLLWRRTVIDDFVEKAARSRRGKQKPRGAIKQRLHAR